MRSYGWRSQPTRAAAPRAAIHGGSILVPAAATRGTFSRAALLGSVCFSAVAILVPNATHAQDATWVGATSDWNTPLNWTPAIVPLNTATFSNTGVTNVSISGPATSIGTIQFTAAAPAYSFAVNFTLFEINGSGIVNNSAFAPSFTNNGAITFTNSSSAGNSAIINNGGGPTLVSFTDTSTAGNATITTNGGAQTQFTSNSDGGNARFITNAGGTVDFSGSSGPLGDGNISAGSIEGAGTYQLGTNRLIVGSNNLSTTVSGSILDGGTFGGTDASLVKTGSGTLTLTGSSNIGGNLTLCACGTGGVTISGGSFTAGSFVEIDGGTLAVTNGGTLQTADVLVAGKMTVTGAGSTVTASGVTVVGFFGPGALTIASGAVFNSQGGSEIDTFVPELGLPSVLVTGSGSTWNVGGPGLLVGNGNTGGPGTLTIANGGTVNSTAPVAIGDFTGTSLMTVTGAGSVLNASSSLTVGDFCGCLFGTLTIADGGVVNSPGFTGIGPSSTLNLGNGGLAGAINTPAIDNRGQIVANFTDTLTLAADISGRGSLTKAGPGTLILTGNSSYRGGTTVTGGTLSITNGNAIGIGGLALGQGTTFQLNGSFTLANNITLAGDPAFDVTSGNIATVSGVIADAPLSPAGVLEKTGAGTLVLTASETYSGGTVIKAGTLQLGAGGQLLSTGALTVNAGGTFDLNNFNQTVGDLSGDGAITLGSGTLTAGAANSTVFSGTISGTGGLVKQGTGALTLSGASSYTGPTMVNAGTLVVDGSLANSTVTVNAGGVLAGIGTVGPTTINSGGTFAPGAARTPATMTVRGNLAFQSGAVYLVQVNPKTASRDNVTIGGTAALAGTVNAVFASGDYATRNYTILSAAGGLGGSTFGALTTVNLPAGFTPSLSYTGTDVILGITATLHGGPNGVGTGNLPINQKNVATALDDFFNHGGTLPAGFVDVFRLTGTNLVSALSQLSGEPATGAQQAGFQMTNQFLNVMLDPFVDGRSGVAGTNGPALAFAPDQETPDDIALAYSSVLKAPSVKAQTFEQRWSVWGSTYGGGNRTSGDLAVVGSHDLAVGAVGFAGGLDYRLTPNSVIGLALAGGGTSWNLAQGLGGGRSDVFQAGLYGAMRSGPAYLAAALAFANHWMSTERFAFAGDHLTASFNAQSYGGRIEGGYRFATIYGGVTPYAAIQAQNFRTPSYSETDTNGGGFALSYNSRTGSDTRSELGTRFDRVLALYTDAVLSLRARLAWAHDWVSDPALAAVFQTLPGASFIVNGATPAKNSALATAGTELRLANGVTLLAKFDGEFASHSTTYSGTGIVRYSW
jgi:autotransporter-associated beta strand protein/T5SS/PEP-CTERM-associated repeat protein